MNVRAHQFTTNKNASLWIEDKGDTLELTLTNELNNKSYSRTYYKIGEIDALEIVKLTTIVYHMHNEVGLNIWDN